MMGHTHLLMGLNALWLLEGTATLALMLGAKAPLADGGNFALCAVAAALGALLPDLDATSSILQNATVGRIRPLRLPGQFLHRRYGHRGFLHSMNALGWLAVLSSPLLWIGPFLLMWPWLCLLLGYGSHLLGDACTKSGIPLFWHSGLFRQQNVHLLPRQLRLTTGSPPEDALFMLLGALALTLALRHLPVGLTFGFGGL